MCSLLGKESLPAERSPQQNRNMELLGEHRNFGMHTHMRTRLHGEYTRVNTCTSISEKGEARQKKAMRSAQMHTCQWQCSEVSNGIMSLLSTSQLSCLWCLTSILPPNFKILITHRTQEKAIQSSTHREQQKQFNYGYAPASIFKSNVWSSCLLRLLFGGTRRNLAIAQYLFCWCKWVWWHYISPDRTHVFCGNLKSMIREVKLFNY